MTGARVAYSAAERKWLSDNRTLPIADYHHEFYLAFGRTDVPVRKLLSLRKRMGWRTGRTGQFEPGAVPTNKGQCCEPGKGGLHPNARATQFAKGSRTGKALLNYKPIGFERVTREGYIERKINDDMPLQKRWRAVHLLRWEALNGPIPAGMALKCLDSDKGNTDPANWELIPRGLLVRLGGYKGKRRVAYDQAAAELRPTLMAMAKLEHKAATARQKAGA